MEEPRKLYPFKFLPIGESFAWGGRNLEKNYGKSFVTSDGQGRLSKLEKGGPVAESHEIADLGYRDSQILDGWLAGNTLSEVMDMYLDRIVGEKAFAYYGRQFPLSIKLIDAEGRTPLMVHPDDVTAGQRYDFLGKAKMWYVLDVRPNASLWLGFRRDTGADELYRACQDGSVEGLLNEVKPKPGDCFHLRPGTVHAAKGVVLLEVSEASPLDFCLHAWGEELPEEEFDSALGLVEALDFIDFKAYKPSEAAPDGKLVKSPEFTATRMDLKDPLHIMAGENGGFAVYFCASGEASVQVPAAGGMESTILSAGETVLVPAEIEDFYLVPRQGGTVLVEVLVEREEEPDAYIDPSAEPELPGEGEEYKFNSVYGRFSKN
jgi:mannose-6-phosphate isomerase